MSERLPRPICPECRDGKHPNCCGIALDPVTDNIANCTCDDPAHHGDVMPSDLGAT